MRVLLKKEAPRKTATHNRVLNKQLCTIFASFYQTNKEYTIPIEQLRTFLGKMKGQKDQWTRKYDSLYKTAC